MVSLFAGLGENKWGIEVADMRYSPKDKCHVAMVKACDEPKVTTIEAGGSVITVTKIEDRKIKEDQQPRVVLAGVQ
eukprot:9463540-Alexandrium_andersonii.AAC.1